MTTSPTILMTGMAPLVRELADASYTIVAGAYTVDTSVPYSVRLGRGIRDLSRPVTMDAFLGVPRAIDPLPGQTASAPRIVIAPEAGPTGAPVVFYHRITTTEGLPLWRILASSRVLSFDLPDLAAAAGLPPLPAGDKVWNVLSIAIPGVSFDQFTYGYLNSNGWSAYAGDTYVVQFPPP